MHPQASLAMQLLFGGGATALVLALLLLFFLSFESKLLMNPLTSVNRMASGCRRGHCTGVCPHPAGLLQQGCHCGAPRPGAQLLYQLHKADLQGHFCDLVSHGVVLTLTQGGW